MGVAERKKEKMANV